MMMMMMMMMMIMIMMIWGGGGGGGGWGWGGGWYWGGKRIPRPGETLCAGLRSQNAHGHFTRAILCGNLQEKCRTPIRGHRFMRACAVKMHMDISQEPFCVEIYRKNAGPQSGDIVLCEPAQSKCTWTFHKSHFVWKFTGKMPDPNPGTSFCASLRSQNAHGHFTRAILCGNLQEKCRTPIRGHRFVRACAVKMHMDISQEPFCVEIYRKNAGPQSGDIVLCEPAQSKCTWTFHKSQFMWKFTGKMLDAPETTSIKHRALTLTVRTPQCGHTVWGKKRTCHMFSCHF